MDEIGRGIGKFAVLGTALYLWFHGYQNGWVIAMFVIGVL